MSEIEAALGSLAPTRGRLDRDRILFRAGQASARPSPSHRGWMVAACLAVVASGEGAMLATRPSPRVVERVVVVREPAGSPPAIETIAPPATSTPIPFDGGPGAHERLAWQVLRYGLDGLPASASSSVGAPESWSAPPRELLRREIRQVLEPGDHS